MRELETDYLVIGAGASGMAFVDALIANDPDAEVVIVDRRHRPGGHWVDAYPFVRLHQPSACYGVSSMPLGNDRIDASGPNAGFYERATAAEIVAYFARVLDDVFLPTGRVRFLGMTDYRWDTSVAVSLLSGEEARVRVRRKTVDATYTESDIPSRHTPSYGVHPEVRAIPPNDLVDLPEPAAGFTVIGAGKTALDTCNWLLDAGVDADRIRWIRPRDPWLFDRAATQPLDLVWSYMELQARWVEACAQATDGRDFAHRLEQAGVFVRIDSEVEPRAFRGATISQAELAALRTIENVVLGARVTAITPTSLATTTGDLPSAPGEVYVDCTAAGVRPVVPRPVFDGDRIVVQYVTIGFVCWSAGLIGAIEALKDTDAEKNALCPPVVFTGDIADVFDTAYNGMAGLLARSSDAAVARWSDSSRLNPTSAAPAHFDDPRVADAFGALAANVGPAMTNLATRTSAAPVG